jgi:hypothetical protein
MPLLTVAGSRSGDSLPAELRSGVKDWGGTALMPSLRLSASGAGLSGNSIWYGQHEGPSGFRSYSWPPFGYRGLSGLGQDDSEDLPPEFSGSTDGSLPSYGQSPDIVPIASTGGFLYQTTQSASSPLPPPTPPQTGTQNVSGVTVTYQYPPGWTGPTVVAPGQATPQAPPGYQYVPMINAAGQQLAQVLAVSQGMGYSTNPATGQTTVYPQGTLSTLTSTTGAGAATVAATQQTAALIGNLMPLLLIGGGVLLVVMMMQRGK